MLVRDLQVPATDTTKAIHGYLCSMKYLLLILSIAVLVLLAGCTAPPSTKISGQETPLVTVPPGTTASLAVVAAPLKYTPSMSSTVGIGLTPEYSGAGPVRYRWETNYGRFLGWNQTGTVTDFNETVVTDGLVYWSFPPADTSPAKPPVTVHAAAIDATGRPVATTEVYIGWEDDFTAVVTSAPCGVTNCHGTTVTCGVGVAEVCTAEYRPGDRCRSLAVCRVRNGTCTVVMEPAYQDCVACAENCNRTFPGSPISAFDCESQC